MSRPLQLVISDVNLDAYIMIVNGLQALPTNVPLFLIINSTGGELDMAIGIYDYLLAERMKGRTVITIASGSCMSAGMLLLAVSNVRYSTPNTIFMMHPGYGGNSGEASVKALRKDLAISEMTDALFFEKAMFFLGKKAKATVFKEMDKVNDFFFDAKEALALGFVTDVGFPAISTTKTDMVVNCMEISNDDT